MPPLRLAPLARLQAYILTFELRDFCVVCTSMYVANLVIFLGALVLFRQSSGLARQKLE